MKKLFTLVSIYRYYRNPKLITKPYWSLNALRKLRNNYERHSFESNLIAGLIKKLRAIAPYQVEDFSGAKKLYEDYFKLPNAIQSIEELNDLLKRVSNRSHLHRYVHNCKPLCVCTPRLRRQVSGNTFGANFADFLMCALQANSIV